MSQWGNVDNEANTSVSVLMQLNQEPSTGNRANLFNNVTPDVWVTGANVGVFGVSATEIANTSGEGNKVTSAGWVLRTEGSGGRAGRVQYETLVAMKSITGDAPANTDNVPLPGV